LEEDGLQIGVAEGVGVAAEAADPVGFGEDGGDALLFGEGREGNYKLFQFCGV